MPISIDSKGDFTNMERWLSRMQKGEIYRFLGRYAQAGVNALRAATPAETGFTASRWSYEIVQDRKSYSIIWKNDNIVDGTPVVILLQYGHGTGTGGFVEGEDFINPALRPIFDQIAREVWKAVTA